MEARQTVLLEVPIEEASAKSRTGGPIEEPDDLIEPGWGGVIGIRTVFDEPIADEDTIPGTPLPPSLQSYRRGTG